VFYWIRLSSSELRQAWAGSGVVGLAPVSQNSHDLYSKCDQLSGRTMSGAS